MQTSTRLYIPEAANELLVVVLVALVAVAVHAVFQRRFASDVLRRHNDVAGYLFSAVGVIYAVVLGFVVVVVWQKYDATVANVETEIAAVSDLYRTLAAYPEPLRGRLRGALTRYTDAMIRVEWPMMWSNSAEVVDAANPDVVMLEKLSYAIDTFSPKTAVQSNAQQVAMTQIVRLFDARRQRVVQTVPSVPAVLWFALISGAVAMLLFAFLFGSENRPAQLIMTAILAGLIAILFIVINEFDSPFSGSVSISDDGWVILQSHLSQIP